MRIARFAILLAVALALVISGAVAGAAGQALILVHRTRPAAARPASLPTWPVPC